MWLLLHSKTFEIKSIPIISISDNKNNLSKLQLINT